jgi:hypothetical protein
MSEVPFSFELAFVMPVLKRFEDMDRLSHRHCKHDYGSSNLYPSVRIRPMDNIYDLLDDIPDSSARESLVDRLSSDFFEEFGGKGVMNEELNWGVGWDIDGYNLMSWVPVYDLWSQRAEKEENIAYIYKSITDNKTSLVEAREDINYQLTEIELIDEEIVKCGVELEKFEDIVECTKHWFDNLVVIVKDYDEEDASDWSFEVVDKSEVDYYSDEGWKLLSQLPTTKVGWLVAESRE